MLQPLKVGDLRQVISLLSQATPTQDSAGQTAGAFTAYATTRALIEPLTGLEFERAKSFGSNTSHRVTIRYRTGVTAKHQVQFGTRIFLVNAVINPEERNYKLQLFCAELL